RIYVERNYSPQLPHGEFDPLQLRKVFLNLLINAVEASPQNSDVELRTRYVQDNGAPAPAKTNGARGSLVISVIDRGAGMSAETKRRLFEAFYTTKRNGTGLGMMITQEIVKKHGGKMEVESEEGKGTTVSVYLPVLETRTNHFPFSVLHLSFAIDEMRLRQWQMTNVIRKMENDSPFTSDGDHFNLRIDIFLQHVFNGHHRSADRTRATSASALI